MDDEDSIRILAGELLSGLGYTTHAAGDGREAVELYQAAAEQGEPFDLVIMDLTVPGGMGGKEAIKKLRQVDPNVTAIVSSGYSNAPIMADFRRYGFAGVVSKPYGAQELSREVERVLGIHSAHIRKTN
jgi:CheY-like chemotaxis protein